MTTLYDISWAFTVYHLLQLTLNAMCHKREFISFYKGEEGKKSYVKPPVAKGFHMLKYTIVNRSTETFGSSNSACFEG